MKRFYLLWAILQVLPFTPIKILANPSSVRLGANKKSKVLTSVKKKQKRQNLFKAIVGSAIGGVVITVVYLIYNRTSKGLDQNRDPVKGPHDHPLPDIVQEEKREVGDPSKKEEKKRQKKTDDTTQATKKKEPVTDSNELLKRGKIDETAVVTEQKKEERVQIDPSKKEEEKGKKRRRDRLATQFIKKTANKPVESPEVQEILRIALTNIKKLIKKINKAIKYFQEKRKKMKARFQHQIRSALRNIEIINSSNKLLDILSIKEALLSNDSKDLMKQYPKSSANLESFLFREEEVKIIENEFNRQDAKAQSLLDKLELLKSNIEAHIAICVTILTNNANSPLSVTKNKVLEIVKKADSLLAEEVLLDDLSTFSRALGEQLGFLETESAGLVSIPMGLDRNVNTALPFIEDCSSNLVKLYNDDDKYGQLAFAIRKLFKKGYGLKKKIISPEKVKKIIYRFIFQLMVKVYEKIKEAINQRIVALTAKIDLSKIRQPTTLDSKITSLLFAEDYEAIMQEIRQSITSKGLTQNVKKEIAAIAENDLAGEKQKSQKKYSEILEKKIDKFIHELIKVYTTIVMYEKKGIIELDPAPPEFEPLTQEVVIYQEGQHYALNSTGEIQEGDSVYIEYYGAPLFRFQPKRGLLGTILAYFKKGHSEVRT